MHFIDNHVRGPREARVLLKAAKEDPGCAKQQACGRRGLVLQPNGIADGATQWLADRAERAPAWLLGYLGALTVGMPAVVYFLPTVAAAAVLGSGVAVMAVGPHWYLRRVGERDAVPPRDAAG